MKLKNLLFVSLLATTFVACSNEEELGNQPQEAKGQPASVFVNTVASQAVSRAIGDVKDLKIGIYNVGGYLVASSTVSSDVAEEGSITSAGLTAVPTGSPYQVLVLANMATELPTNLSDSRILNANTADFAEEKIPMSSEIISVTLYPGVNYLGFGGEDSTIGETIDPDAEGTEYVEGKLSLVNPIKLTRNVAGIQLVGVKFDLTQTAGDREYTSINASLSVVGTLIKDAAANMDLVNGNVTDWLHGEIYSTIAEQTAYYWKAATDLSFTQKSTTPVEEYTDVKAKTKNFYVLTDGNKEVILAIKGTYTLGAGTAYSEGTGVNKRDYVVAEGGDIVVSDAYYKIKVGATSTNNVVLPNYLYSVNATITGRGDGTLDTPGEGDITDGIIYKIDAADWSTASQDENIGENH